MISSRAIDVYSGEYSNITYIGQLNENENKDLTFGMNVSLEKNGVHYTNGSRPEKFLIITNQAPPNISYRSLTIGHGDYIKDLEIIPVTIKYIDALSAKVQTVSSIKVLDLISSPNFIRGCQIRFITPPNLDMDILPSEYYDITIFNDKILKYSQNSIGYYQTTVLSINQFENLYVPIEAVLFNQQIINKNNIENEVPIPPPAPPQASSTVHIIPPSNQVNINQIPTIVNVLPPINNQSMKVWSDPIAKPTEESLIEIKRLGDYVKQKDKAAETARIIGEIQEIKYSLKNIDPSSTNGLFYAILATVIAGVIINKI